MPVADMAALGHGRPHRPGSRRFFSIATAVAFCISGISPGVRANLVSLRPGETFEDAFRRIDELRRGDREEVEEPDGHADESDSEGVYDQQRDEPAASTLTAEDRFSAFLAERNLQRSLEEPPSTLFSTETGKAKGKEGDPGERRYEASLLARPDFHVEGLMGKLAQFRRLLQASSLNSSPVTGTTTHLGEDIDANGIHAQLKKKLQKKFALLREVSTVNENVNVHGTTADELSAALEPTWDRIMDVDFSLKRLESQYFSEGLVVGETAKRFCQDEIRHHTDGLAKIFCASAVELRDFLAKMERAGRASKLKVLTPGDDRMPGATGAGGGVPPATPQELPEVDQGAHQVTSAQQRPNSNSFSFVVPMATAVAPQSPRGKIEGHAATRENDEAGAVPAVGSAKTGTEDEEAAARPAGTLDNVRRQVRRLLKQHLLDAHRTADDVTIFVRLQKAVTTAVSDWEFSLRYRLPQLLLLRLDALEKLASDAESAPSAGARPGDVQFQLQQGQVGAASTPAPAASWWRAAHDFLQDQETALFGNAPHSRGVRQGHDEDAQGAAVSAYARVESKAWAEAFEPYKQHFLQMLTLRSIGHQLEKLVSVLDESNFVCRSLYSTELAQKTYFSAFFLEEKLAEATMHVVSTLGEEAVRRSLIPEFSDTQHQGLAESLADTYSVFLSSHPGGSLPLRLLQSVAKGLLERLWEAQEEIFGNGKAAGPGPPQGILWSDSQTGSFLSADAVDALIAVSKLVLGAGLHDLARCLSHKTQLLASTFDDASGGSLVSLSRDASRGEPSDGGILARGLLWKAFSYLKKALLAPSAQDKAGSFLQLREKAPFVDEFLKLTARFEHLVLLSEQPSCHALFHTHVVKRLQGVETLLAVREEVLATVRDAADGQNGTLTNRHCSLFPRAGARRPARATHDGLQPPPAKKTSLASPVSSEQVEPRRQLLREIGETLLSVSEVAEEEVGHRAAGPAGSKASLKKAAEKLLSLVQKKYEKYRGEDERSPDHRPDKRPIEATAAVSQAPSLVVPGGTNVQRVTAKLVAMYKAVAQKRAASEASFLQTGRLENLAKLRRALLGDASTSSTTGPSSSRHQTKIATALLDRFQEEIAAMCGKPSDFEEKYARVESSAVAWIAAIGQAQGAELAKAAGVGEKRVTVFGAARKAKGLGSRTRSRDATGVPPPDESRGGEQDVHLFDVVEDTQQTVVKAELAYAFVWLDILESYLLRTPLVIDDIAQLLTKAEGGGKGAGGAAAADADAGGGGTAAEGIMPPDPEDDSAVQMSAEEKGSFQEMLDGGGEYLSGKLEEAKSAVSKVAGSVAEAVTDATDGRFGTGRLLRYKYGKQAERVIFGLQRVFEKMRALFFENYLKRVLKRAVGLFTRDCADIQTDHIVVGGGAALEAAGDDQRFGTSSNILQWYTSGRFFLMKHVAQGLELRAIEKAETKAKAFTSLAKNDVQKKFESDDSYLSKLRTTRSGAGASTTSSLLLEVPAVVFAEAAAELADGLARVELKDIMRQLAEEHVAFSGTTSDDNPAGEKQKFVMGVANLKVFRQDPAELRGHEKLRALVCDNECADMLEVAAAGEDVDPGHDQETWPSADLGSRLPASSVGKIHPNLQAKASLQSSYLRSLQPHTLLRCFGTRFVSSKELQAGAEPKRVSLQSGGKYMSKEVQAVLAQKGAAKTGPQSSRAEEQQLPAPNAAQMQAAVEKTAFPKHFSGMYHSGSFTTSIALKKMQKKVGHASHSQIEEIWRASTAWLQELALLTLDAQRGAALPIDNPLVNAQTSGLFPDIVVPPAHVDAGGGATAAAPTARNKTQRINEFASASRARLRAAASQDVDSLQRLVALVAAQHLRIKIFDAVGELSRKLHDIYKRAHITKELTVADEAICVFETDWMDNGAAKKASTAAAPPGRKSDAVGGAPASAPQREPRYHVEIGFTAKFLAANPQLHEHEQDTAVVDHGQHGDGDIQTRTSISIPARLPLDPAPWENARREASHAVFDFLQKVQEVIEGDFGGTDKLDMLEQHGFEPVKIIQAAILNAGDEEMEGPPGAQEAAVHSTTPSAGQIRMAKAILEFVEDRVMLELESDGAGGLGAGSSGGGAGKKSRLPVGLYENPTDLSADAYALASTTALRHEFLALEEEVRDLVQLFDAESSTAHGQTQSVDADPAKPSPHLSASANGDADKTLQAMLQNVRERGEHMAQAMHDASLPHTPHLRVADAAYILPTKASISPPGPFTLAERIEQKFDALAFRLTHVTTSLPALSLVLPLVTPGLRFLLQNETVRIQKCFAAVVDKKVEFAIPGPPLPKPSDKEEDKELLAQKQKEWAEHAERREIAIANRTAYFRSEWRAYQTAIGDVEKRSLVRGSEAITRPELQLSSEDLAVMRTHRVELLVQNLAKNLHRLPQKLNALWALYETRVREEGRAMMRELALQCRVQEAGEGLREELARLHRPGRSSAAPSFGAASPSATARTVQQTQNLVRLLSQLEQPQCESKVLRIKRRRDAGGPKEVVFDSLVSFEGIFMGERLRKKLQDGENSLVLSAVWGTGEGQQCPLRYEEKLEQGRTLFLENTGRPTDWIRGALVAGDRAAVQDPIYHAPPGPAPEAAASLFDSHTPLALSETDLPTSRIFAFRDISARVTSTVSRLQSVANVFYTIYESHTSGAFEGEKSAQKLQDAQTKLKTTATEAVTQDLGLYEQGGNKDGAKHPSNDVAKSVLTEGVPGSTSHTTAADIADEDDDVGEFADEAFGAQTKERETLNLVTEVQEKAQKLFDKINRQHARVAYLMLNSSRTAGGYAHEDHEQKLDYSMLRRTLTAFADEVGTVLERGALLFSASDALRKWDKNAPFVVLNETGFEVWRRIALTQSGSRAAGLPSTGVSGALAKGLQMLASDAKPGQAAKSFADKVALPVENFVLLRDETLPAEAVPGVFATASKNSREMQGALMNEIPTLQDFELRDLSVDKFLGPAATPAVAWQARLQQSRGKFAFSEQSDGDSHSAVVSPRTDYGSTPSRVVLLPQQRAKHFVQSRPNRRSNHFHLEKYLTTDAFAKYNSNMSGDKGIWLKYCAAAVDKQTCVAFAFIHVKFRHYKPEEKRMDLEALKKEAAKSYDTLGSPTDGAVEGGTNDSVGACMSKAAAVLDFAKFYPLRPSTLRERENLEEEHRRSSRGATADAGEQAAAEAERAAASPEPPRKLEFDIVPEELNALDLAVDFVSNVLHTYTTAGAPDTRGKWSTPASSTAPPAVVSISSDKFAAELERDRQLFHEKKREIVEWEDDVSKELSRGLAKMTIEDDDGNTTRADQGLAAQRAAAAAGSQVRGTLEHDFAITKTSKQTCSGLHRLRSDEANPLNPSQNPLLRARRIVLLLLSRLNDLERRFDVEVMPKMVEGLLGLGALEFDDAPAGAAGRTEDQDDAPASMLGDDVLFAAPVAAEHSTLGAMLPVRTTSAGAPPMPMLDRAWLLNVAKLSGMNLSSRARLAVPAAGSATRAAGSASAFYAYHISAAEVFSLLLEVFLDQIATTGPHSTTSASAAPVSGGDHRAVAVAGKIAEVCDCGGTALFRDKKSRAPFYLASWAERARHGFSTQTPENTTESVMQLSIFEKQLVGNILQFREAATAFCSRVEATVDALNVQKLHNRFALRRRKLEARSGVLKRTALDLFFNSATFRSLQEFHASGAGINVLTDVIGGSFVDIGKQIWRGIKSAWHFFTKSREDEEREKQEEVEKQKRKQEDLRRKRAALEKEMIDQGPADVKGRSRTLLRVYEKLATWEAYDRVLVLAGRGDSESEREGWKRLRYSTDEYDAEKKILGPSRGDAKFFALASLLEPHADADTSTSLAYFLSHGALQNYMQLRTDGKHDRIQDGNYSFLDLVGEYSRTGLSHLVTYERWTNDLRKHDGRLNNLTFEKFLQEETRTMAAKMRPKLYAAAMDAVWVDAQNYLREERAGHLAKEVEKLSEKEFLTKGGEKQLPARSHAHARRLQFARRLLQLDPSLSATPSGQVLVRLLARDERFDGDGRKHGRAKSTSEQADTYEDPYTTADYEAFVTVQAADGGRTRTLQVVDEAQLQHSAMLEAERQLVKMLDMQPNSYQLTDEKLQQWRERFVQRERQRLLAEELLLWAPRDDRAGAARMPSSIAGRAGTAAPTSFSSRYRNSASTGRGSEVYVEQDDQLRSRRSAHGLSQALVDQSAVSESELEVVLLPKLAADFPDLRITKLKVVRRRVGGVQGDRQAQGKAQAQGSQARHQDHHDRPEITFHKATWLQDGISAARSNLRAHATGLLALLSGSFYDRAGISRERRQVDRMTAVRLLDWAQTVAEFEVRQLVALDCELLRTLSVYDRAFPGKNIFDTIPQHHQASEKLDRDGVLSHCLHGAMLDHSEPQPRNVIRALSRATVASAFPELELVAGGGAGTVPTVRLRDVRKPDAETWDETEALQPDDAFSLSVKTTVGAYMDRYLDRNVVDQVTLSLDDFVDKAALGESLRINADAKVVYVSQRIAYTDTTKLEDGQGRGFAEKIKSTRYLEPNTILLWEHVPTVAEGETPLWPRAAQRHWASARTRMKAVVALGKIAEAGTSVGGTPAASTAAVEVGKRAAMRRGSFGASSQGSLNESFEMQRSPRAGSGVRRPKLHRSGSGGSERGLGSFESQDGGGPEGSSDAQSVPKLTAEWFEEKSWVELTFAAPPADLQQFFVSEKARHKELRTRDRSSAGYYAGPTSSTSVRTGSGARRASVSGAGDLLHSPRRGSIGGAAGLSLTSPRRSVSAVDPPASTSAARGLATTPGAAPAIAPTRYSSSRSIRKNPRRFRLRHTAFVPIDNLFSETDSLQSGGTALARGLYDQLLEEEDEIVVRIDLPDDLVEQDASGNRLEDSTSVCVRIKSLQALSKPVHGTSAGDTVDESAPAQEVFPSAQKVLFALWKAVKLENLLKNSMSDEHVHVASPDVSVADRDSSGREAVERLEMALTHFEEWPELLQPADQDLTAGAGVGGKGKLKSSQEPKKSDTAVLVNRLDGLRIALQALALPQALRVQSMYTYTYVRPQDTEQRAAILRAAVQVERFLATLKKKIKLMEKLEAGEVDEDDETSADDGGAGAKRQSASPLNGPAKNQRLAQSLSLTKAVTHAALKTFTLLLRVLRAKLEQNGNFVPDAFLRKEWPARVLESVGEWVVGDALQNVQGIHCTALSSSSSAARGSAAGTATASSPSTVESCLRSKQNLMQDYQALLARNLLIEAQDEIAFRVGESATDQLHSMGKAFALSAVQEVYARESFKLAMNHGLHSVRNVRVQSCVLVVGADVYQLLNNKEKPAPEVVLEQSFGTLLDGATTRCEGDDEDGAVVPDEATATTTSLAVYGAYSNDESTIGLLDLPDGSAPAKWVKDEAVVGDHTLDDEALLGDVGLLFTEANSYTTAEGDPWARIQTCEHVVVSENSYSSDDDHRGPPTAESGIIHLLHYYYQNSRFLNSTKVTPLQAEAAAKFTKEWVLRFALLHVNWRACAESDALLETITTLYWELRKREMCEDLRWYEEVQTMVGVDATGTGADRFGGGGGTLSFDVVKVKLRDDVCQFSTIQALFALEKGQRDATVKSVFEQMRERVQMQAEVDVWRERVEGMMDARTNAAAWGKRRHQQRRERANSVQRRELLQAELTYKRLVFVLQKYNDFFDNIDDDAFSQAVRDYTAASEHDGDGGPKNAWDEADEEIARLIEAVQNVASSKGVDALAAAFGGLNIGGHGEDTAAGYPGVSAGSPTAVAAATSASAAAFATEAAAPAAVRAPSTAAAAATPSPTAQGQAARQRRSSSVSAVSSASRRRESSVAGSRSSKLSKWRSASSGPGKGRRASAAGFAPPAKFSLDENELVAELVRFFLATEKTGTFPHVEHALQLSHSASGATSDVELAAKKSLARKHHLFDFPAAYETSGASRTARIENEIWREILGGGMATRSSSIGALALTATDLRNIDLSGMERLSHTHQKELQQVIAKLIGAAKTEPREGMKISEKKRQRKIDELEGAKRGWDALVGAFRAYLGGSTAESPAQASVGNSRTARARSSSRPGTRATLGEPPVDTTRMGYRSGTGSAFMPPRQEVGPPLAPPPDEFHLRPAGAETSEQVRGTHDSAVSFLTSHVIAHPLVARSLAFATRNQRVLEAFVFQQRVQAVVADLAGTEVEPSVTAKKVRSAFQRLYWARVGVAFFKWRAKVAKEKSQSRRVARLTGVASDGIGAEPEDHGLLKTAQLLTTRVLQHTPYPLAWDQVQVLADFVVFVPPGRGLVVGTTTADSSYEMLDALSTYRKFDDLSSSQAEQRAGARAKTPPYAVKTAVRIWLVCPPTAARSTFAPDENSASPGSFLMPLLSFRQTLDAAGERQESEQYQTGLRNAVWRDLHTYSELHPATTHGTMLQHLRATMFESDPAQTSSQTAPPGGAGSSVLSFEINRRSTVMLLPGEMQTASGSGSGGTRTESEEQIAETLTSLHAAYGIARCRAAYFEYRRRVAVAMQTAKDDTARKSAVLSSKRDFLAILLEELTRRGASEDDFVWHLQEICVLRGSSFENSHFRFESLE